MINIGRVEMGAAQHSPILVATPETSRFSANRPAESPIHNLLIDVNHRGRRHLFQKAIKRVWSMDA